MKTESTNPAISIDVLSLCDRTGNMVRPWAENGDTCLCIDIQHPPEGRVEKVGKGTITYLGLDVRWFYPPQSTYKFAFAQPPCTNLAISGARWFKEKALRGLTVGIELVERSEAILESLPCPWAIENPISTLASYWRKPDYKFDPADFAGYSGEEDNYTKKTCLWANDKFKMPKPKKLAKPPDKTKIHYLPPSEDRGDKRSETPKGFAQAVYEANK